MPQAAQRGNPGPLSSPARQPRSSQRPTAANPALQPAWRGHGPRNYDRRWGGSPPREVPGEQLTGAARPGRNSSAPRAAVYLLVPGYVAGKGGLSPRGPIIIRMLLRHPPGWAGRPVGRIPHCLRGSPADWPTGWAHSAFPTWPPEGPATPRPQLLSQYDPFSSLRRRCMVWVKVIRDRRAFLVRLAFPVIPNGAHARGVRSGDWLQ